MLELFYMLRKPYKISEETWETHCSASDAKISSQNRETESTTTDSDDIVVNNSGNEFVVLLGADGVGVVDGTISSGVEGDGFGGSVGDEGDVGELAVVGGTLGVEAVEVQGVGVLVVTSDGGDGGGVVPGVDQGVVVGVHLETVSVLVDEGAVLNGVDTTRESRANLSSVSSPVRLDGGVVGPFGGDGGVAGSEEQDLDSVGETDIVLRGGVGGRGEGLARGSLDLFDEDIAGGTGHALTFVVGDDGVVGVDVDTVVKGGGTGDIGGLDGAGSDDAITSQGVDNEQFGPVAELELDAHFIVGEGGGGEGNTGVASEEEGEGDVEGVGGEGADGPLVDEAGGDETFTGELRDVTDHVVVTDLLGGGDSEGSPEVQVVGVEAGSDEIVEGDAAFADQVVADVLGPADSPDAGGGSGDGLVSGQSDGGEGDAQPGVEEVITSTRDGDGPFSVEFGGTSVARQDDWDLGEPSGLASFADEVGSSVATTIHVLFKFVVGSQINKAGSKITSADRCHFLFNARRKFF
jgi:hypothetical protein